MLFDTFHVMLSERDVYESILRAGSAIGHVHLADTNRRPPGYGMMDWRRVIEALKSVGYEGYASIEARFLGDPLRELEVSVKTLKPLL